MLLNLNLIQQPDQMLIYGKSGLFVGRAPLTLNPMLAAVFCQQLSKTEHHSS